jgi:hypothetical protein
VPLIAGFVPFQTEGVEDLGGGYVRVVPTDRPVLVHVLNPLGLGEDEETGRPCFDLGTRRTKVIVYSPREVEAELLLTLRPYPDGEGSRLLVYTVEGGYNHRHIRRAVERPPDSITPLAGQTNLRIPLRLGKGLTMAILLLRGEGADSAQSPLSVIEAAVVPVAQHGNAGASG